MSQEQFSKELKELRVASLSKVRQAVEYNMLSQQAIYAYGSYALKEAVENRKKNTAPEFHADYMPNFTEFQYDLEFQIFLDFETLRDREIELCSTLDPRRAKILISAGPEYGCTLFKRDEHLNRAILIRWPEKINPDGSIRTAYALTPWSKKYTWALANYQNIVCFGGGGQGKTYSSIAFMSMLYDHFIKTKPGAACVCSTVNEGKLKSSIWSHMHKIYSFKNGYRFSRYANLAQPSADYAFVRKNAKNKRIEEGGEFKGVLLVKGAKTSMQTDKLTGQHDVMARAYLLDEAQSTGPAPLSAYNNMFLHPPYKWFMMAGNYELDEDLLGMNTEPLGGWETVNEETHTWESTLKSPDSDLGHKSIVIHYNNDLSPAMLDKEICKRYSRFMPSPAKKRALYPDPKQWETYEYKRMWVGFRFERVKDDSRPIITVEDLKAFGAYEPPDIRSMFTLASLDSAPGNADRDLLSFFKIGLDDNNLYQIWPSEIISVPKPRSQFNYYKETSKKIADAMQRNGVQSGHAIMDWTQRPQLLEALRDDYNFVFHHFIYQEAPPGRVQKNEITKILERPIEMESVPTWQGDFEKESRTFAHERFANKITLGAYVFRLAIENGRWRGINSSIFKSLPDNRGFEKEMCKRHMKIVQARANYGRMIIDSKDEFKKKYKFSPDVFDTFLQVSYLIYVIFGIRNDITGLGSLKKEETKKVIDNSDVSARLRFASKKSGAASNILKYKPF